DDGPVDAAGRDLSRRGGADAGPREIVAVHRDVEGAVWHGHSGDLGHRLGDPSAEEHSARGDPEENDAVGSAIGFKDLVRDTRECARNISLLENDSLRHSDLLSRLT